MLVQLLKTCDVIGGAAHTEKRMTIACGGKNGVVRSGVTWRPRDRT
jgi:hypothetical protein